MPYRLTRHDKMNWALERFHPGGELLTKGIAKGHTTKDKWVAFAFYGRLEDAAKRLLDEEITEEWPQDGWTGEDLENAIENARDRVLAELRRVIAKSTGEEL